MSDPFAGFAPSTSSSFTPSKSSSFTPSTSSSFTPSTSSSFTPSTSPSTSIPVTSTSSSFAPSTSSSTSIPVTSNEIKAASLYYYLLAVIRSLSIYLADKKDNNVQLMLTNLISVYGNQVQTKCPPQFIIQKGGKIGFVNSSSRSSSSSSGSSQFFPYSSSQILEFIKSDKLPDKLGDAIPGLQKLISMTTPDNNNNLNPRVFKFKEDLYDLANAAYYACKSSQPSNIGQITPRITSLLASAKVTSGKLYGSVNNYDTIAKDILNIYNSVSSSGGKRYRTHRKSKKHSKLKRRKGGKSRRHKSK